MRSSSSPRAAEVQRARVLARPGMTAEKFAAIAAKQMPDAEKRQKAHFLVDTGRGFAAAERQVGDILRALAGTAGPRARPDGRDLKRTMREIILDTETTGTDPAAGDRVIEIGCVELVNQFPTGRTFHAYVNPQRSVSQGAFNVHGLSEAFLADKPVFAAVAEPLLEFVGDGRLVIHNAGFDIAFLNAEFARTGHPALDMMRVVDTLSLARRKHPGRAEQPRRALRPLRHRQFAPHQARRAPRRRAPVRSLHRAHRRQAGRSQPVAAPAPSPPSRASSFAARSGVAVSRLTDAERDGSPRLHREPRRRGDLARLRGYRRIAVTPGVKRSGAPRKGGCYAAGVPPAAAGPGWPGAAWPCSAAFWRYSVTKSIGSM